MSAEPLALAGAGVLAPGLPASGSGVARRRARTLLGLGLGAAAVALLAMPPIYLLAAFHRLSALELKPHVMARLAVCCACNFVVMIGALRAKGRLDRRLVELCTLVLTVHGSLALITQLGRLYYSIPMMLVSVLASFVLGLAGIWLRARVIRIRVGVLGSGAAVWDDPNLDCVSLESASPRFEDLDLVLVAEGAQEEPQARPLLMRALLAGKRVRHLAEFLEEGGGACDPARFEIDDIGAEAMAGYRPVKRALDVVLVLLATPLALPIALLAAAAILLTMGRPVLFRQQRVGLGGRPFEILKLRTMRASGAGEAVRATVQGDPRITPLGGFLRRFRIDELPQLINVLRGEMSLIGPRPEQPGLAAIYNGLLPAFAMRQLVRPGITGWAQVRAGYAADAAETSVKLSYDLYYLKYFSFGLDLQILVRTPLTLLHGGGVR